MSFFIFFVSKKVCQLGVNSLSREVVHSMTLETL